MCERSEVHRQCVQCQAALPPSPSLAPLAAHPWCNQRRRPCTSCRAARRTSRCGRGGGGGPGERGRVQSKPLLPLSLRSNDKLSITRLSGHASSGRPSSSHTHTHAAPATHQQAHSEKSGSTMGQCSGTERSAGDHPHIEGAVSDTSGGGMQCTWGRWLRTALCARHTPRNPPRPPTERGDAGGGEAALAVLVNAWVAAAKLFVVQHGEGAGDPQPGRGGSAGQRGGLQRAAGGADRENAAPAQRRVCTSRQQGGVVGVRQRG